jgi:tungstate transport system substrate-binding protein
MRVISARLIPIVVLLTLLLGACAPAASPPQAPAPTAAAQAEPTLAPAPTAAPEPTAAPTVADGDATLILATTTSTADSGLLDFILPDFEQKFNATVDVIAVGTGQALEIGSKGDADVVLVHSRKGEDQFVADGHATRRDDVMYNDFIVVGPKDDPAKITGMSLAKDAFKAIMDAEQPFASRGDKSGTHSKELSIWSSLQVTPTADMKWYNSIGQGMGDTLLFANEQQAYTVADRGTYLSMRDKLPDLAVLVGGNNLAENADKALLNPYGVLAVSPEKHPNVQAGLAQQFVAWLLSAETQELIGGHGVDAFGQPLFYPNATQ